MKTLERKHPWLQEVYTSVRGTIKSLDSSVQIMTWYRLGDWGLIPSRDSVFPPLHYIPGDQRLEYDTNTHLRLVLQLKIMSYTFTVRYNFVEDYLWTGHTLYIIFYYKYGMKTFQYNGRNLMYSKRKTQLHWEHLIHTNPLWGKRILSLTHTCTIIVQYWHSLKWRPMKLSSGYHLWLTWQPK